MNQNKTYLFTSEAVSAGHPDKVADQISDAILDAYIHLFPEAHVAVETLCTYQTVILSGEICAEQRLNHEKIVRDVVKKIGYTDSSKGFSFDGITVVDLIHDQSPDIHRGVVRNDGQRGAGDQGMMFGYATNETEAYIPATLHIANVILQTLDWYREGYGKGIDYLQPDAKAQVTIEYDHDNKPVRVTDIVISTMHNEFGSDEAMHQTIEDDMKHKIMPTVVQRLGKLASLLNTEYRLHVNPTGKFVKGSPAADTGLTGRKIIVDTYGGRGAHGGGAFSGKDPSKVDRSGAYMARYIAKNIVAAGLASECLVQLAYVIGESQPVSVHVNTNGTALSDITDSLIEDFIKTHYDLSPNGIETKLFLRHIKYLPTASYGHFGRPQGNGTFTWEALDDVNNIRYAFNLDSND